MMSEAIVAQKGPFAVELEAGRAMLGVAAGGAPNSRSATVPTRPPR